MLKYRYVKYTFTTLLLCVSCLIARAQFTDSTHYHAVLSSSGAINKTNDGRSYLLNNSLNFGVKKKSITFNTSNTWIYGKQNKELTNNDFSSSVYVNLYKTFNHFYYWGLVNYNTSYSLKVNNQLLAGAGVAYSFFDKPNVYVNVSDGVLYDQSNLLVNEIYNTYRNSFRLQFHFLIKDMITLDGSHFLQSSFSNGNDYIIRSNTTLGIRLRKWISLTTALNYNRMNITRSDNLNFTYGLSLDKHF
ncbi:hypothetical protein GCM10023149_22290 [Mucilaginibacter gynuensis]|uniref:DUF481 domain-containing protein n=1 Tax=Mucilaginibacter gynuensis TaxID=1302236 RepID=A0ABP8GD60_9SPHI